MSVCLACGKALAAPLERSGSLRCHDCRDTQAPLRAELCESPIGTGSGGIGPSASSA